MKKILSILLALTMIVGLVPAMFVSSSAVAHDTGDLTAINSGKNGRVYHYYESFDTDTVVRGASAVIDTLGWQLPEDSTKQNNHKANVTATEGGADGVPMYEIKGGRLYLRNHGTADEYMLICTAEELADVLDGPFTVEYTVTYLASSYTEADGYFSLLFNADNAVSAYGEVAIRISGYGNNTSTFGVLDAGDVSGAAMQPEITMTSYRVNNMKNPTLYERLCGDVSVLPGTGNVTDLRGSQLLANKQLNVRLSFDGQVGPRVYINDVLVSDPTAINDTVKVAAAAENYADLLANGGSALGFCVSPGVECVIDEIVLYDGISEGNELGDLYITEIATLPDNANAPYIEIYNAGTESVSLADYTLGYTYVNKDGYEITVQVSLADYVGYSFKLANGAVAENAATAMLAAGESAVIFPVNAAADVADLVGTVGANNLSGFRNEYALGQDLVIAVPFGSSVRVDGEGNEQEFVNNCTIGATEYRVWFVGSAGVDFTALDIEGISASADVDSCVALIPSMAFGYDLDITDTSFVGGNELDPIRYNFGRAGDVMPGYAAHFVYGADASATANSGLMISRSYVKIKDEMNVGKLLGVQSSYFKRIADYRAGAHDISGSLSITEIVPHTEQKDAFDCFEITNLGAMTVNLYEYGVVSSGNALYGSLTDWTRGTAFTLNPTESIVNPTNAEKAYLLAPGETVVVWNMTAEGYTVEDFRSYYDLPDDVTVIVAASLDAARNVTVANKGTVTYGIAAAADINALVNGTADKVEAVVSDVILPLHSVFYEIEGNHEYTWNELAAYNPTILGAMAAEEMDGCLMNGVRVAEGKSLAGYYTQVEVTVPSLTLADGTVLTNYTYTTYKPCLRSEIADGSTVYYAPNNAETFRAYGSKQNTQIPTDYAVSFCYGKTVMADKSCGALMSSLYLENYAYDNSGRGYAGALPYLVSTSAPFIVTDVIGGAAVVPELGMIYDEQGVSTTILYDEIYYDVTYLDENGAFKSLISFNANTCRDVYVVLDDSAENWTVNGVLYAAGEAVTVSGDTVIAPACAAVSAEDATLRMVGGTDSELRFTTGVSRDLYDDLAARYGAENVSLKTAIVPTANVNAAGAPTLEALNARGFFGTYTVVKTDRIVDQTYNTYYFAGSVSGLADADCAYTGIGYIEVYANGQINRYYGSTASSASLQDVASNALHDVSSIRSATYCNEIACGVYSPYTADQLQAMRAIG